MSESWKNRFRQLVLVCTFAVVLSVCNKAVNSSSDNSSSSGTAIAEESSTVTVSSMPNLTVSSLPNVTVGSASLPTVSAILACTGRSFSSGVVTFEKCDSTDSTSIDSADDYSITLANAVSAGFQPCSVTGSGKASTNTGFAFGHFFFCK